GGDAGFLPTFVQLFKVEMPRLCSEVRFAVTRSDTATLRRVAHELKGVLMSLGAKNAVEIASQLEEMGRENQADVPERLLLSMEHEVACIEAAIESLAKD